MKTHEIVLLQGTQSDLLSIYSLLGERVYNKVDKALGILRVFPSAGPVDFGKNFRRLVVSKTPLGIVSPDTLAHMVAALNDPALVCVSLKWNDDPFFSDAISSTELQQKGLRFGSFFSNSMSMLRCSLWESLPLDETLPAAVSTSPSATAGADSRVTPNLPRLPSISPITRAFASPGSAPPAQAHRGLHQAVGSTLPFSFLSPPSSPGNGQTSHASATLRQRPMPQVSTPIHLELSPLKLARCGIDLTPRDDLIKCTLERRRQRFITRQHHQGIIT